MKKILVILLATFAISAQAKETITVIYGWSPADTAANFSRSIVNEANKIQDKYTFIFDTKPGAGASIAAQYVANNPNTILATSSAFWIRPQFFPNESHDPTAFKEILPQCDAPLGIYSKKYKSWTEVPADKPLTISVSGLGITTHLVATEVAKKFPQMQVIPFKSTTDATLSVISGTTDFSVAFMGDGEQYVNAKDEKQKLYLLGITGSTPDGKVPTLITQGFPKILSQMNAPSHLVVPNSWPDTKFNEVRDILMRAGRTKGVSESYSIDHCAPMNQMPTDQIQPWFNKQSVIWKRIASGITLK